MNLLVICLIAACGQSSLSVNTANRLVINAPQAATQGNMIQIVVQAETLDDNVSVGLVMVGVQGARVYNSYVINGTATFTIPPQHTQFSGYVALVATVGDIHGEASFILTRNVSA